MQLQVMSLNEKKANYFKHCPYLTFPDSMKFSSSADMISLQKVLNGLTLFD